MARRVFNFILLAQAFSFWILTSCASDESSSKDGTVKTSTFISVLKRSRVILPCEFRTEGIIWYTVSWEKDNGDEFETVADYTRGDSQPRFEPTKKVTSYISEGREKINFDLVITKVEDEDAATYRCRVLTSSGERMGVTSLQVADSDSRDDTDYSVRDSVSDGDLALYVGLPLGLLVLILILVIVLCYLFRKRRGDWPMKFMQPRRNSQDTSTGTDVDSDYNITHIYSSVRSSYRPSLDKTNSTGQTVSSITSSEYETPVKSSTSTSVSEDSYDSPSPPYLKLTL